MAGIKRFEEIIAWQKARQLVSETYRVCGVAPFSRDFGLKDQICRAAVSSMTNVAEGFGRKSSRDFAHFLDVARGSTLEVQSLLYVAHDLEYLELDEFEKLYRLAEETVSVIAGLTSYLRNQTQR
jgi:four helix bundle protein